MKTKFLLSAGIAMILASCSDSEEIASPRPLADTPMAFNLSVGEISSRAGYDNSTPPTDFMLFIKQDPNKNYSIDGTVNCNYNYGNVHMTSADGVWKPVNMNDIPLLWKSSQPNAEVIAYTLPDYTYVTFKADAPSTKSQISINCDQTNDDNIKKSDFLYAHATNQNPDANGSISITLSHKLSQLKVVLTKGTELDEDITFESVSVDECCRLDIYANLADGTLTEMEGAQNDYSIYMMHTPDKLNWQCILVPQTINPFSVRIKASDDKEYVYTSTKEFTFASGTSYTLNLKIGRDKVTSGEFTADSWQTSDKTGDLVTE